MRRSRTVLPAVSTALRAAASQDSLLTPITSVTRYTPSDIRTPFLELAPPTLSASGAACGRARVRRETQQQLTALQGDETERFRQGAGATPPARHSWRRPAVPD